MIALGLRDLTDYQIVYPNGATEKVEGLSAYELQATLSDLGYTLGVVSDSSSVSTKSILVGKTTATVGEMPTGNNFSVTDRDGVIQIAAGSYYGYRAALDYIVDREGIYVGVRHTGTATVSAAEQKPNGALRVMFYNLYGYNNDEAYEGKRGGPISLRHAMQLELFATYAPDVICFQEYTADSHNMLTDQLNVLGYVEVPSSRLSGDSVNDTPIFYKESAVTLVTNGYGYHSYMGGEDYNNGNTKSLSWAVFTENKTGGKQFAVVSTHLMYNANSTDHTAQRQQNVVELLAQIGSIKTQYPDILIIVGGDLNCFPDSAPFNDIENGGFTWMREAQGVNTDTLGNKGYSTYSYTDHVYTVVPTPHATNGGIDHAFYSGNISVINYLTLIDRNSCLASDHPPKLADIILN